MKKTITIFVIMFTITLAAFDNEISNNFSINEMNSKTLKLSYEMNEIIYEDMTVNGKLMKNIVLNDVFLPNESGRPNLPILSRAICIPQNSRPVLKIRSFKKEIIENIQIAPSPNIPFDTDDSPLVYKENNEIYSKDAYYPNKQFKISEITKIRGVDAAVFSITPFQYNPVQEELIVYKELDIEIELVGGNGQFGEDRLRSRYWDPILHDVFLNSDMLDEIDHNKSNSRTEDYEYLIITPDDSTFLNWADSIRVFRNEQGIQTGIVTTNEIGGNNPTTIENYIDDAYDNWDVPPSAILLLGDYGTSGNTIISPIWDGYCASDHIYADVNGNNMADIILARITAQNEDQLATMIGKFLNYERSPSTNPNFYNNPITALGWQTERWFQICSESVGGFWHNELGKDQVRINEIYDGNPQVDPWSTASNTTTVLNVFGPNGENYIPASPSELGDWSGGNAADINNAINSGAFMLQHRDHGGITGWGEPDYGINNLYGLNNEDLVFVLSINCLTGKYNANQTCFAEAFHRHDQGALGLIAASEVSYSFVNDTFVWGMYDNMWKDFLPQFGDPPSESDWIRPAFANAAGKYFLWQSQWPANQNNKEVTYNLFHHHGDAFTTVHTEMPQELTVSHSDQLLAGLQSFNVNANEGAMISLTVDGDIIAVAEGTGSPLDIAIPVQQPDNILKITVTKQNYYRYSEDVMIISPDQYVICDSVSYLEIGGYIDDSYQSLDTLSINVNFHNIGLQATSGDVEALLTCESNYIDILNDNTITSSIPASSISFVENAFQIKLLPNIPDLTEIEFTVEITSGGSSWESTFILNCMAPQLVYDFFDLQAVTGEDPILDPGETGEINLSLNNAGNGYSYDSLILLTTEDPYVDIDGASNISQIAPGDTAWTEEAFILNISNECPIEYFAELTITAMDAGGAASQADLQIPIGFFQHNFETGVNGWEHMSLSEEFLDEWHRDDYRNHTDGGSYSMKLGGDGPAYYSNYVHAALIMPEFELGSNTFVKFHHWMDAGSEGNSGTWDGGMIQISVDEGDWFLIEPVDGYPCELLNLPNSPFEPGTPLFAGNIDWEEVTLDLSQYSGNARVRFVFGSVGLITGEGWYIDDVNIMNYTGSENNEILSSNNYLGKNYPNPFNPSSAGRSPTTTISFNINQESDVELEVYNLRGQKVRTLVNERLEAGLHDVIWNGKDDAARSVSSGIYFYKLKAANFEKTKKMILLK